MAPSALVCNLSNSVSSRLILSPCPLSFARVNFGHGTRSPRHLCRGDSCPDEVLHFLSTPHYVVRCTWKREEFLSLLSLTRATCCTFCSATAKLLSANNCSLTSRPYPTCPIGKLGLCCCVSLSPLVSRLLCHCH